MSNLSIRDKGKRGALFLASSLLFAVPGAIGGMAKPVADAIAEAKALLASGKRARAVERLDQAKALAKSRQDAKEIEGKRILFLEQFLTSDSFQKYQEARALAESARWEECPRELESVSAGDQDNLPVLRLRAECLLRSRKFEAAGKALQAIVTVFPDDAAAALGLVEVDLALNRAAHGLAAVESIDARSSLDIERRAILKARLLEQSGSAEQAFQVLDQDHEAHLDHVEVLYELGMLYSRVPGHDWPARRMLSLFLTRCKRLGEGELRSRRFDASLKEAQATLTAIDRRLGI